MDKRDSVLQPPHSVRVHCFNSRCCHYKCTTQSTRNWCKRWCLGDEAKTALAISLFTLSAYCLVNGFGIRSLLSNYAPREIKSNLFAENNCYVQREVGNKCPSHPSFLGVPFLFLHLIHFYLSFFCFGAEIGPRSLHMLGKHPTPEPLCSHCLNEHTLIYMCA